MENTETSLETRISEKLNEISEKFSASQNERSEVFQKLEDGMRGAVSEVRGQFEELSKSLDSLQKKTEIDLETALKAHEATAKNAVKKIQSLYDEAGRNVLAADFAGNAISESKSYKAYSKLAAAMFVLSASFTRCYLVVAARGEYALICGNS